MLFGSGFRGFSPWSAGSMDWFCGPGAKPTSRPGAHSGAEPLTSRWPGSQERISALLAPSFFPLFRPGPSPLVLLPIFRVSLPQLMSLEMLSQPHSEVCFFILLGPSHSNQDVNQMNHHSWWRSRSPFPWSNHHKQNAFCHPNFGRK